METRRRIPTGSKGLDAQLLGGIPLGELTLVYGEPGSGKTPPSVRRQLSPRPRRKSYSVDKVRTIAP
jgi:predicted ATP-dependent serine protease